MVREIETYEKCSLSARTIGFVYPGIVLYLVLARYKFITNLSHPAYVLYK
jgi:hypothetical protein